MDHEPFEILSQNKLFLLLKLIISGILSQQWKADEHRSHQVVVLLQWSGMFREMSSGLDGEKGRGTTKMSTSSWYHVSDSVSGSLNTLIKLNYLLSCSVLPIRKLRIRKLKHLIYGHQLASPGRNRGNPDSCLCPFTISAVHAAPYLLLGQYPPLRTLAELWGPTVLGLGLYALDTLERSPGGSWGLAYNPGWTIK
jgi:hypothetical protein